MWLDAERVDVTTATPSAIETTTAIDPSSARRRATRRRIAARSSGNGSTSRASSASSALSSSVCIIVLLELDAQRAQRLVQRRLHGSDRAAHRFGDVGELQI